MLAAYRRHVVHPRLHLVALVLGAFCVIATIAYYAGVQVANLVSWTSWLAAVAAYAASFVRLAARPAWRRWTRPSLRDLARSEVCLALVVLLIYLATHLWNFPLAPWNWNGLFDDAAWDIYFANNHAFNGPYAPAIYDPQGAISRETIFHYYIAVFFKLLGPNLLVFNVALLVLGAVTVVFTTLVVHRLFRSIAVTFFAALVINLFPLHYMHVWVGHRYAMAAPLMMVSLYFLYSGFQDRSSFRLTVSAFFAALCLGGAIMGKQYILGLALAAILLPLADRKRWAMPEIKALAVSWIGAFLISAVPLLIYVVFNSTDYFRRESGLFTDFVAQFVQHGYAGIKPFVDGVVELFFAPATFTRLWLSEFPLIPHAYWLLLLPGLFLALRAGRLEIVFLSLIPVGSALFSGPFDFRVLLSVPIWVIAMAFAMDAVWVRREELPQEPSLALANVLIVAIIAAGVIPSALYIGQIAQNPHSQHLLSHRDVGVSRLMQDVIAGNPQPTAALKPDEFTPAVTDASLAFDNFACPERAYGVAHLYLQRFDDKRILDFCDGGNQGLLGSDGVLEANLRTLGEYQPTGRGLRLIWEESAISQTAITRFRELEGLGTSSVFEANVDGRSFSIRVLTIPAENVAAFDQAVDAMTPAVDT